MEALAQYVVRLVALTIVFSVLEIIMPSGNMKKFGRLAIGIVLLYSAVAPVVAWLGAPDINAFSIGIR